MDDPILDLQAAQGWTDETMLELAMQFIQARGLEDRFLRFLEDIADDGAA